MSEGCPIFRGTGKKAKLEEECQSCPFRDDCIADILDDAEKETMEIWGKTIKKVRKLLERFINGENKIKSKTKN